MKGSVAQGGACVSSQHGSLLLKVHTGAECQIFNRISYCSFFYVVPMSLVGQGGVRNAYWRAGAFAASQLNDLNVRCMDRSRKRLGRSHFPLEQGKI